MAKVKFKSGMKGRQAKSDKELSSSWGKIVAPQAGRVHADARKLISSLKKLMRSSLQSAAGQCRRRAAALRQHACDLWEKLVLQCRKAQTAARERVQASWRRVVKRYNKILALTRRAYKSYIGLCNKTLAAAKQKINASWQWLVKQCRRVLTAIRLVYKNFIILVREALAAAKQKISASWQWLIRQCSRVLTTIRLVYKNFIVLVRETLAAAKQKINASWQWLVKQCRRVLISTRQIYKSFVEQCRSGHTAARQQIYALGQRVVRQYRRVLAAAKQIYSSCQKLVGQGQKTLAAARQSINSSRQKLAGQGQKVLAAARLIYQKVGAQCRHMLTVVREQVNSLRHKLVEQSRRLFAAAKLWIHTSWQSMTERCLGVLAAARKQISSARKKIVRQYRRALVVTRRIYTLLRRAVRLCRRQYRKGLAVMRRAIRQSPKVFAAARLQMSASWQNLCRRALAATREIDISLESAAEQNQKALAATTKRIAFALARQCRRALAFPLLLLAALLESAAKLVDKLETRIPKATASFGSWAESVAEQCLRVLAVILKQISLLFKSIAIAIGKLRLQKAPVSKPVPITPSPILDRSSEKQDDWTLIAPVKQMRSFFSRLKAKLPSRDRIKILKNYNFGQWVNLSLIVTVNMCLFIVSYLFINKYRYSNGTGLAAGNGSFQANLAYSFPGSPIDPSLLAVGKSPRPKNNSEIGEKPSGYSFWPKRVTLRHVEGAGAGIGYGTDYSTIAMLITPDYRVGRILPMLDLRGHRFDNNKYAANVGIAGRYIPNPNKFCQILGLNAFYDFREGWKGGYHQIGVGLEVLGKRWDLRANGYAPIGVHKRKTKCVFNDYIGDFFAIHRECEFTSYGYNAEVGYYVVRSNDFFLYAAIGPYYMVRRCHDRTRGGEFRIRPQYKDYFALDFSVSCDDVFGAVFQAQVILYLPLYQLSSKGNKHPCNLRDQQIYQPIERFEVMPLGRRSCWKTNF